MNEGSSPKIPVLLEGFHAADDFDCGDETLNTYLKKFAYIIDLSLSNVKSPMFVTDEVWRFDILLGRKKVNNNQNSSARTYVAVRGERVVGYYTLTPGSVIKEDAPRRVGKGLANHPIPVIILVRLAVDKTEQGAGLGKGLLRDALLRIIGAADIIGGRAILVHAKDKSAKSFYEHFGFEPSPIDQFHLYLLLKDIKKTLGY